MAIFAHAFGRRYGVDAAVFYGRFPIQKAFLDFNLLIGASKINRHGLELRVLQAALGGRRTRQRGGGRLDR